MLTQVCKSLNFPFFEVAKLCIHCHNTLSFGSNKKSQQMKMKKFELQRVENLGSTMDSIGVDHSNHGQLYTD